MKNTLTLTVSDLTFSIGERTFVIRPLTIGQLEDIEGVFVDGALKGKRGVRAAIEILQASLKPDYPEFKIEDVRGMKYLELQEISRAVLQFSGLVPAADAGPSSGEASAGAEAIPST